MLRNLKILGQIMRQQHRSRLHNIPGAFIFWLFFSTPWGIMRDGIYLSVVDSYAVNPLLCCCYRCCGC